jgi:hypothetical protein
MQSRHTCSQDFPSLTTTTSPPILTYDGEHHLRCLCACLPFATYPRARKLTCLSLTLANAIHWNDGDRVVVYNPGDIAWTLASMALVWIMIPGLGFFYSGLLRRKNALSMIYLSVMTIAVVSFQVSRIPRINRAILTAEFVPQWFFWGFSLTFSDTGGLFIGDLSMYLLLLRIFLVRVAHSGLRIFWS